MELLIPYFCGYFIAAIIIGPLAARKNRNGLGWGLLGGFFLVPGLLVLMFLPFLCPKCQQSITNNEWKQRDCPRCGDISNARRTPAASSVSSVSGDRLRALRAQIQQGNATVETYMEVAAAHGGSLTPKGFLFNMHYLVDLGSVQGRVNDFADLRQWFLDNMAGQTVAAESPDGRNLEA